MRDDFTKFSTISQWFETLIHPALMQRPFSQLQAIAMGIFICHISIV
ncbi:MAG: hypothetical protein HRU34_17540 [Richelia sp.]|nr:hypothetical protein [Richelia sp.]